MSEPPHFADVRRHLDGFEAALVQRTLSGAPSQEGAVNEDVAPLPGTPEPPD